MNISVCSNGKNYQIDFGDNITNYSFYEILVNQFHNNNIFNIISVRKTQKTIFAIYRGNYFSPNCFSLYLLMKLR